MNQPFTSATMYGRVNTEALALVKTRFVRNVYTWMAGGLALTAAAATMTLGSPTILRALVLNPIAFFALILAELGLVIWLSGWINRMSVRTATWAFLGYSLINGMTMSVILLRYTAASIGGAFFVAAGTFGAAAVYGTITRRDLNTMGSYLFMGLVGIIIATVVNIFLASTVLYWVLTYVSVLVFVGLTAYDAQKVQQIGLSAAAAGEGALSRSAIIGALALYLDFVNIFLLMLRIFGQSRD
jgi:FtsH-binding integral membrane protein